MMFRKSICIVLFLLLLNGCVGYIKSTPTPVSITTEFKNKEHVLASLGEPLNIKKSTDSEIWYYLLSEPVIKSESKLAKESHFFAVFVFIPVWWDSELKNNLKVKFKNSGHIEIIQIERRDSGFMCNAFGMHPFGDAGCKSIR